MRTNVLLIALLVVMSSAVAQQSKTQPQPPQPSIPPFKEQPPPPGTPGGPPLPTDTASPVEKLGPGTFRLGTVVVDQKQGTVTVPGSVNMQEGLVELFACGPRGKRHESVMVLDANPHNIQVGLLLLGLEPGPGNLEYQGDPRTPLGDPVDIFVRFNDPGGRPVKLRAEDTILDQPKQKAMERTHWVFTGSKVVDGTFMAGMEQSIVTTYHDPFTIIDNPLPAGGDDTVYYVNSKVVPPVGTRVDVIFQKVKR